jgi:hypothetical protein
MFRCFFQPRSTSLPPKWLPSLNNPVSGSRGLLRLADFRAETPPDKIISGPGLRSGPFYLSLLRKKGIQNHKHALKTVKHLTKHGMYISMASVHAYDANAEQYIGEVTGSANADFLARMYLRHHHEKPLWRLFHVYVSGPPIVKGKLRVRVLSAWYQALRNHGYGRDGEPFVKGQEGARELFGTVDIRTHDPLAVLHLPFERLRAYFETVVKTLQQHLGRPARAQGIAEFTGEPVMAAGDGHQTQKTLKPWEDGKFIRPTTNHGGKRDFMKPGFRVATATQHWVRPQESVKAAQGTTGYRDQGPVFSVHPKATGQKPIVKDRRAPGYNRQPNQTTGKPWK